MAVRLWKVLRARWRMALWTAAATFAAACTADSAPAAAGLRAATRAAPEPSLVAQASVESLPLVSAAQLTAEQRRGQQVYDGFCWTCHGLYGHGDGPGAYGFPHPLPDVGRLATPAVGRIVARMLTPRGHDGTDAAAPVWHALPPESLRLAVSYLATMNPAGSPGNPAAGRLLFAAYCVQCHGARGAGDGRLAAAFAPRPADLRALRYAGRQAQVLVSIREGGSHDHRAYMPVWGRVMTDAQLWDVLSYLPTLKAAR